MRYLLPIIFSLVLVIVMVLILWHSANKPFEQSTLALSTVPYQKLLNAYRGQALSFELGYQQVTANLDQLEQAQQLIRSIQSRADRHLPIAAAQQQLDSLIHPICQRLQPPLQSWVHQVEEAYKSSKTQIDSLHINQLRSYYLRHITDQHLWPRVELHAHYFRSQSVNMEATILEAAKLQCQCWSEHQDSVRLVVDGLLQERVAYFEGALPRGAMLERRKAALSELQAFYACSNQMNRLFPSQPAIHYVPKYRRELIKPKFSRIQPSNQQQELQAFDEPSLRVQAILLSIQKTMKCEEGAQYFRAIQRLNYSL